MLDNVTRIPERIPCLKAKQVAAGGSYTALIDLSNNVWSFGNNELRQLGLNNNVDDTPDPKKIPNIRAIKIAAGDASTAICLIFLL